MASGWAAGQSRTFVGAVGAVSVGHEVDLVAEVAGEPVGEAAHSLGGEAPGEDLKCIRPLVLIAGIAFTENRFPAPPLRDVLGLPGAEFGEGGREGRRVPAAHRRLDHRWHQPTALPDPILPDLDHKPF